MVILITASKIINVCVRDSVKNVKFFHLVLEKKEK